MEDEDSNFYINEKVIEGHGHGNPITFTELKNLINKVEKSMCKIKGIGEKGTGFLLDKIFQKLKLIIINHFL